MMRESQIGSGSGGAEEHPPTEIEEQEKHALNENRRTEATRQSIFSRAEDHARRDVEKVKSAVDGKHAPKIAHIGDRVQHRPDHDAEVDADPEQVHAPESGPPSSTFSALRAAETVKKADARKNQPDGTPSDEHGQKK